MVRFTVNLAEIPIGVQALFPSTEAFCADYITTEMPAFTVAVSEEDILAERIHNAKQMERDGQMQTDFSDAYMETLALYRKIVEHLLCHNVILFHGAVLALDGKAYVFTAKSGTGKTTHTRLWLKHIPGCHILNGDKPLFLFKEGGIFACGTPWQGKENYGVNEILPIEAVCLLERDTVNHIEPLSFSDAFPHLLSQTYRPKETEGLMTLLQLLGEMKKVKLYRLGCNMNPEAAFTAYQGMVPKK